MNRHSESAAHDPAEVETVALVIRDVHGFKSAWETAEHILTALAPAFAEARAEGAREALLKVAEEYERDAGAEEYGGERWATTARHLRDLAATHGEAGR